MSTQDDVQLLVSEIDLAAAQQVARLRVLAGLVKDWPSSHVVTFSNGEQISTNLMHAHAEQIEQQIARLAPHVVKWE